MTKAIDITFTEDQATFYQLPQKYTLFSGGLGSGKTSAMIRNAFMDSLHSASSLVGLFQPKYELIESFIFPLMEVFLKEQGVRYTPNKKLHEIYTSNGQMGDFIFRSFDKPELIVGYEVYRAHVDELDVVQESHARLAWNKIMGRTRQWPKDLPESLMVWSEKKSRFEPKNTIRAYSTPEGYKFTYKQWKLSKDPEYGYLCADSRRNSFLPDGYLDSLMSSYPEQLVNAYVRGEWVNMASGAVYASYNPELHNSTETIRAGEPLYIGCDFNVRNVNATIWVKREGGQEWHVVEELTGMYDTPEMIRIITERWKNKGHDITMYPDASNPSHTNNASITDISLLKLAGFKIKALDSKSSGGYKNPGVKDRISTSNMAFTNGRARVNKTKCPTVSDCLIQQAYDKNGEPDKKSGHDHCNDATTYVLAYELRIKKQIYQIPVSWAI